tara:strand:- start:3161 stop:4297 length:1137 start_codon:yes stop_codon:yes gene_type:complete
MIKKENIKKIFKNIKISNKNFLKIDFWSSEFHNSKFLNCKFQKCIFSDVKFNKVVFENCEIVSCNFQHASFINSKMDIFSSKNNLMDDVKVDQHSQLTNNFFKKKFVIKKKEKIIKLNKKEQKIYNSLTKGKGYIILKNYYSKKKIYKAFKILDRIVINDRKIKIHKKIFERNKRNNQKWVRSLINIDPVFSEFLLPKVVKKVFSKLIGEDFICGSYAANCLLPGARGQELHIDYPHYRFVSPGENLPYQKQKNFYFNLQIITPFTAFTKNNGTTAIVENSHKKNRFPDKIDIKKSKIKLMEMKPGSILIYNGLLWHGATPNFSRSEKRYGIIAQYMPNYIVPMEDLMKMTDKKFIKKNKTIKSLFGFDLEFPAVYKS